ncbi:hypothetical protein [Halorientalis halophila]|uniref:hypothetical protein n=1 Tax=Halorientalis halophila TaxID=3108499 RepID=UPI00300A20D7
MSRPSVRSHAVAASVAAALPLLVGTASASATGQVGSIACQLGIGDLVTFAFAVLAAFHVVKGAFTATAAFSQLGSTRADRRRQGRRAMMGALQVTAGAFFPILAGVFLEVVLQVDIGACIHFV